MSKLYYGPARDDALRAERPLHVLQGGPDPDFST